MSDSSIGNYPCYGYIYNNKGKYEKGEPLPDIFGLYEFIETKALPAISEKREVRITDCDDYLIFHARKGIIEWPPKIILSRLQQSAFN